MTAGTAKNHRYQPRRLLWPRPVVTVQLVLDLAVLGSRQRVGPVQVHRAQILTTSGLWCAALELGDDLRECGAKVVPFGRCEGGCRVLLERGARGANRFACRQAARSEMQ